MKVYSSGMSTRLAFATFLYLAPDILVVDEALAVGDIFFQRKCFAAMADTLKRGTTVLLVSHDMGAIAQICTRVILLEHGEIAFIGAAEEAIARFFARGAPPVEAGGPLGGAASAARAPADLAAALRRHSILTASAHSEVPGLRIAAARLLDEHGRHTAWVKAGERIAIQLLVAAEAAVSEPELELELYDRFNRLVSGVSLARLGVALPALAQGEARAVTFRLTLALEPGEYTFTLAAYDRAGAESRAGWCCHDRRAGLGPLHVAWEHELLPFYGIASLECSAELDAAPRGP